MGSPNGWVPILWHHPSGSPYEELRDVDPISHHHPNGFLHSEHWDINTLIWGIPLPTITPVGPHYSEHWDGVPKP